MTDIQNTGSKSSSDTEWKREQRSLQTVKLNSFKKKNYICAERAKTAASTSAQ